MHSMNIQNCSSIQAVYEMNTFTTLRILSTKEFGNNEVRYATVFEVCF